jgi:CheY-like chemotaxis protein
LARTVQSSFIISDLSMPKMDGWIMIQQLRQNPDTVHIPIIALTAHAMSKDREKALAAGFNAYITKPITPGGFIGDLLRILAGIPSLAPQLSQNDREH